MEVAWASRHAPPTMVHKLLRACVSLWFLGILGMWIARALLGPEPGDAPFRVAAACWVLGGVGFTWFAGLSCLAHARSNRSSAPARPGLLRRP